MTNPQNKQLVNHGILRIGTGSSVSEKTIIVVGVARGGTSIVSGSLNSLGLFMGDKSNPPVYEDVCLSTAFEGGCDEDVHSIINDYNNRFPIWGWKRPSSLDYLEKVVEYVRCPHFIFVFRDLLSIANRNNISMKLDTVKGLEKALDDYTKIVHFLSYSSYPTLLVSSDKIIRHKAVFIEALCDFVGFDPTPEQISSTMKFITPDPADYLDKTRTSKVRGSFDLDLLKTGVARGWAFNPYIKDAVIIEVIANGSIICTSEANVYRDDLFERGVHPTGHCGFEFDLNQLGVFPTDEIQIRAQGDVVDLPGSPVCFAHLKNWLTHSEWETAKVKGVVNRDLLKTGVLRGWARAHGHARPLNLEVLVDDQLLEIITADIFRPHLKSSEIHPTSKCGYDLDLKLYGVKPSSTIRVRVENDVIDLPGSGVSFPDMKRWLTVAEWKVAKKQ